MAAVYVAVVAVGQAGRFAIPAREFTAGGFVAGGFAAGEFAVGRFAAASVYGRHLPELRAVAEPILRETLEKDIELR